MMAEKEKEAPKKDVASKDAPAVNPDGDHGEDLQKFAEPKGTVHNDQYNTQFPGERTIRKG